MEFVNITPGIVLEKRAIAVAQPTFFNAAKSSLGSLGQSAKSYGLGFGDAWRKGGLGGVAQHTGAHAGFGLGSLGVGFKDYAPNFSRHMLNANEWALRNPGKAFGLTAGAAGLGALGLHKALSSNDSYSDGRRRG